MSQVLGIFRHFNIGHIGRYLIHGVQYSLTAFFLASYWGKTITRFKEKIFWCFTSGFIAFFIVSLSEFYENLFKFRIIHQPRPASMLQLQFLGWLFNRFFFFYSQKPPNLILYSLNIFGRFTVFTSHFYVENLYDLPHKKKKKCKAHLSVSTKLRSGFWRKLDVTKSK